MRLFLIAALGLVASALPSNSENEQFEKRGYANYGYDKVRGGTSPPHFEGSGLISF